MMLYEDAVSQKMKPAEPEELMPDQDDAPNPEEGDKYIGMEVKFTRGFRYQCATVAHRKQNVDGVLIGLRNDNPILDTMVYEDMFSGGKVVDVLSNQVAESILTSCNTEVDEFMVFREILYHRSDDMASSKEDVFIHQPKQAP